MTAYVRFIHFDGLGKDLRDILDESLPYPRESSQYPFSVNPGPQCNILTALFEEEPGDDRSPLISYQV